MPLREFGGFSRAELLKTMWAPVTSATDLRVIGNHVGALINAAAEYASIELSLPDLPMSIRALWIHFIGVANIANMNLDVSLDWGSQGQASNNHTASNSEAFNTTATIITSDDITWMLGGNLSQADILGIRCVYKTNTNVYVLGAGVRWF